MQLHLLLFYLTNLRVSPPAVDSLYFHSSASVITKNSFHGIEVLDDVSKVCAYMCVCAVEGFWARPVNMLHKLHTKYMHTNQLPSVIMSSLLSVSVT